MSRKKEEFLNLKKTFAEKEVERITGDQSGNIITEKDKVARRKKDEEIRTKKR